MKSGIASNETASAMPNDPLRNTCIRYIKSYTGSVNIRTRLKLQIVQPAKRAGAAPDGREPSRGRYTKFRARRIPRCGA
jgi:hypothetical protein